MRKVASAILALVMASSMVTSAQKADAQGRDSLTLYGTWRWIDSAGGNLPGRSTPAACGCERLLILRPKGTYEFVEQDSTHEYLLCDGRFTIHRGAGLISEHGWPADFWLSFEHWWMDHERDQLVQFVGSGIDTLLTYPGGPDHGVSDALSHRFARAAKSPKRDSTSGRRIRLTLRDRPTRSEIEDLPGENEFVYYEDAPIAISQPEPVPPEVPRTTDTQYEVLLHVLVGKDGRVKNVKVVRGWHGLNEAAVEEVKKWIFKPARSNNKPVAVWIEIPINFRL